MRPKTIFLALVWLLLCTPPYRTATGQTLSSCKEVRLLSSEIFDKNDARACDLNSYLSNSLALWHVPGMSVVVLRKGQVVFAKGYGVQTAGSSDPVDPETIFAIGSDTKQFTTTLIGMLVDDHKLNWDTPVSRLLPGFQLADPWMTRELTLRDLLTHRTGLARADMLWHASGKDRKEILQRMRYLPQEAPFRTRYGYNNLAYIVAGEAAAAAGGADWDKLIATRILQPLGMVRSSTSIEALSGESNVASPHWISGSEVRVIPRLNLDNLGPAGSINSTAMDMSRWIRFQLADGTFDGKTLISEGSLRATRTPQVVMPFKSDVLFASTHFKMYGMGWNTFDYQGLQIFQHTGGVDGMQSEVVLVPEAGLGFAILSNAEGQNLTTAALYRVLDTFLGKETKDWSALLYKRWQKEHADETPDEKPTLAGNGATPSHPLMDYVGLYSDPLYGDVEVRQVDGKLQIKFGPQHMADLEHLHYDSFLGTWNHPRLGTSTITFTLANSGTVEKLQLGNIASFSRKP
jgi:CubicO group peptidase (beta-lactamase class C family)